ncbi:MAG: 16S rRNA (uracil1498-N3)-methyltransferase [Glomeribacter sp. 1016415]|uniref:Ribosomal RNA small subunit methyltransferase E n=1 Tax=Mycoavidus cysteinexigens TaxID=1553431 RepID=A0A2Z6ESC4_9BURK|nr:16S rRNA (uracil(1498)-N(3))-methyltransferase [Mycoavidus cysteinexigens]MCX8565969.1 16S rRNA (uracil1498-N3)-methyltransferase [Glomeribacter sp. 1016415]BBE08303.1 surface protein [Mycoavidus cysteinexigens]GAM52994.1 ribosomal RNA small subunit methyltransferase E [bacterium endosymbiont of Mortierella elongata FMR23-6]GLR00809.1 ribosomal RNA small subunit methyltransferase E [Mycoavidus cysteinexigens]
MPAIPRFFVAMPLAADTPISLPNDVARHMRVLRLAAGDPIILFNGTGGAFKATVLTIDKKHILAQVTAPDTGSLQNTEPPYQLILAQGIAAGDKMDWLIEKAVELGVHQIIPIATAKSVVRLVGERAARRHHHWQALVHAACEQCGRNRPPLVAAPVEFTAWLNALPATAPANEATRFMLSPRATRSFQTLPATPPSTPIIILIGPEGGLTTEEEQVAAAHGFLELSLGPRILRTETAGIAALAGLAIRWSS